MDKDLKFKVILLSLGLLTLFLYSSYAFGQEKEITSETKYSLNGDVITETRYHKKTVTPRGGTDIGFLS